MAHPNNGSLMLPFLLEANLLLKLEASTEENTLIVGPGSTPAPGVHLKDRQFLVSLLKHSVCFCALSALPGD